jgi:hypothetical protein
MSTAVKSDGKIQSYAEKFIDSFDELKEDQIMKAVEYFSSIKQNNREVIDDINLPTLCGIICKFYNRFNKCPAIFKKYCEIKLKQGKTSWAAELKTTKLPWE